MGNRAVITTETKKIGVYVHWNGGRNSVDAFLAYCKAMKYREPENDCYGWARLVQTIANWFGSEGLSVGIDIYKNLDTDNGDNGIYVIKDWKIVKRIHSYDKNKKPSNKEDLIAFLKELSKSQPKGSQLDESQIKKAAEDYLAMYDTAESK